MISWDVTFAPAMTRRKSLTHWAEASLENAGSAEGEEGDVGSRGADRLREAFVKGWEA